MILLPLVLCVVFASFLISLSPLLIRQRPAFLYCRTRYPLVLVHGLGRRYNNPLMAYWGGIPAALRRSGAAVYVCDIEAFGTYRRNGELIRQTVEKALKECGCAKVNLIAYSKGGIDARYYISALGGEAHTASLVSLAVPHRGSFLAEYIIEKALRCHDALENVVEDFFAFLGDRQPDADEAFGELTRSRMAAFNEKYSDSDRVRYLSFAGKISDSYPNPFWKRLHALILPEEGPNDGFVAVRSAEWGEFLGFPLGDGKIGSPEISHADIAGVSHFSWNTDFSAEAFFRRIAHLLHERGL